MDDPVVIAEYSPSWPQRYLEERARILTSIGPLIVEIEHVGSTAVPGLAAKPVIDMMIGVRSLDAAPACLRALRHLGYEYVPELELSIPERRYFRRWTDGIRTHQIHLVEVGGAFWDRHLLFRNYLREHPHAAAEYEVLKRALAASHAADRVAYTDAKTNLIKRFEARARRERGSASSGLAG